MNTETQVSPGEETQNPAPETTANQTPEVAEPEAVEAEQQTSDTEDDGDKSLKRMQRRIDRRTADLYRERAERERLASELESLRSQLPQDRQPQPQLDEKAIEQRAREIARVTQIAEKSNSVYAKGKESYPDFDDALRTVTAEAGPLIDKSHLPTTLGQAILDSDKPEALLHHLGKNPDLAAELADLSPTQLARRLVRIEDQMSAKPKTSAAPKPLKPVKPSASNDMPADEDDVNTWIKKERARMAGNG